MSPTVMLFAGGLMVFTAMTLTLSMVGVVSTERRGVARSLAAIQALDTAPDVLRAELERPFAERVLAPLGERLVGVGRRLVRAGTAERIQHRLDIAGNPAAWDVGRIIGLKVAGLAVLSGLAFVYTLGSGASLPRLVVYTVAAGAFGYVLPNILLYNAGTKREALMQRALPDALDLLTISVEAGLGFDAAVMKVARNTTGPAGPGVLTPAPGDADRGRPRGRHARRGRTHHASRTSSRSAWPWSRPTSSASRSDGSSGSRARRCASSAASEPRRRRSRSP